MPRLLLVDDNPSIHKIAESLLGGSDVHLLSAESGDFALQLLARGETFDVAMVDIYMGGTDGWGVLDAIRSSSATARVPVALMAGVLDTVDPERLEKAPIQGFLKKPVELRDLPAKVADLLRTPVELPEPPKAAEPSAFSTVPAMPVRDFSALVPEAAPEVSMDDLLLLTAEDLLETPEAAAGSEELVLEAPSEAALDLEPVDLTEEPTRAINLAELPMERPETVAAGVLPDELVTMDEEVELPDLGPSDEPSLTLDEAAFADLAPIPTATLPEMDFPLESLDTPAPEPAVLEPEAAAPETASVDWADESDDLLSAIQAALPTAILPEGEGVSTAPVQTGELVSPDLELGVGAAMMAGAAAAAAAEAPQAPVPSAVGAPVLDASALVEAIIADPVLMDQLAQALARRLPVTVLREVAWEVLPELAERLRTY